MNSALLVAIIGVVGIAITAAGGYFVARRKTSGTISTTEAETLWAQNEKLLDRWQKTAEDAIKKSEELTAEVSNLRAEGVQLRNEALALREEATLLRSEAAALRIEAEEFREETRTLREDIRKHVTPAKAVAKKRGGSKT